MGLKTAGEKLCFQGGLFGAAVHVALHEADPEAANELSGASYARIAVDAGDWTVGAASGRVSNTAAIDWPAPTAAWAKPTHVGLWDAAILGALLASGALNDVPAPAPGANLSFAADALAFDLATDD